MISTLNLILIALFKIFLILLLSTAIIFVVRIIVAVLFSFFSANKEEDGEE